MEDQDKKTTVDGNEDINEAKDMADASEEAAESNAGNEQKDTGASGADENNEALPDEQPEDNQTEGGQPEGRKVNIRKEKKEKKDKKDKKDAKIEELNDKLVRLMAEYDNYRKRTDREKSAMFEMGAKSIVEKVIPIIDNFERGFDCVAKEQKEDPFVQGMEKIYKQMTDSLAEMGVTAIEAVGREFDPNIHNAVMHIDDEEYDNNIVVEEFQKGYMYRDTLIRCSMVKVAN